MRTTRTVGTVVSGLLLAVAACDSTTQPASGLIALSPDRAYADAPVAAALHGGPFRPSLSIDTSSGTANVDLRSFGCWLLPSAPNVAGMATANAIAATVTGVVSPTQLSVSIPAGLPAGVYDVELRDPAGRAGFLKSGFRSLGPDRDAPDVSLNGPLGGTYVIAGTRVPVIISANDGDGHLTSLGWVLTSLNFPAQTHTCPSPQGAARATCSDGEIVLPPSTALEDRLSLRVDAQDQAGNIGSREDLLLLAQIPVITVFAPSSGPSTGMTEIVVQGRSFVRGTRVLIDGVPITPAGGIVESDMTIRGFTAAHDPGPWPVVVETGNKQTAGQNFTYVAVPVLRRMSPDNGPSEGGTMVTIVGSHFVCDRPGTVGTQFSVGAGVLRIPVMVTDCAGSSRVVATMPPYPIPPDGTGTVTLFALDPAAGESTLPDAFTYTSLPKMTPPPPSR
ncbi:MAG TPA: IPT/TIG domain-containing protein [Polyangia bacterium]|nr:IPT/TIG domain-containing protein [Polyangia bacterium]